MAHVEEEFLKEAIGAYADDVIEHLEEFGYHELVYEYVVEDVSTQMGEAILECFTWRISPIMCAILIWSSTMRCLVIPDAEGAVKH